MKHFNLSTTERRCKVSPQVRALQLLMWLVVMLILPNLILAFTEDYNGWSAVAGIILPLGLYLLTPLITRRVSLIVVALLPIMALCAVQMVLLYLYGNSIIAVDMFTNIMTTNAGESRELLRGLAPIMLLVSMLYLPMFYAVIRQIGDGRYSISEQSRGRTALVGAILTIVGVQLLYPAKQVSGGSIVQAEIFPANVIRNFVIALQNRRAVENYPQTSADFDHKVEHSARTPEREIYIFVIGESSRAANWELYGYQRQTNPLLGRRENLLLFKNVITQSNTTHKSVPLMLSSVDAESYDELFERKGLASLFREAGFASCFISTQSPQGAMVDNLAKECDEINYLDLPSYDMQLLQTLQRVVESTDEEKLFFVLHCYGSHYCYNQRYPAEFSIFLPDRDSAVNPRNLEALHNSYDNSIRYTDALLNSIIAYLEGVNACSAMLYCSDHGEDLFDDEREMFLHSAPRVTYYQLHVPCLAWFSEEYCRCYPDKVAMAARHRWSPTTTSALFHTIADIASIRGRFIDYRHSLVSPLFDESAPRLYLNDRNEAVQLDHRIGLSDLDRHEFLLHGIRLD